MTKKIHFIKIISNIYLSPLENNNQFTTHLNAQLNIIKKIKLNQNNKHLLMLCDGSQQHGGVRL